MKKILSILLCVIIISILTTSAFAEIPSVLEPVPAPINNNIDVNGDGHISIKEIERYNDIIKPAIEQLENSKTNDESTLGNTYSLLRDYILYVQKQIDDFGVLVLIIGLISFVFSISILITHIVETNRLKRQLVELKDLIKRDTATQINSDDDIPVVEPELVYKK